MKKFFTISILALIPFFSYAQGIIATVDTGVSNSISSLQTSSLTNSTTSQTPVFAFTITNLSGSTTFSELTIRAGTGNNTGTGNTINDWSTVIASAVLEKFNTGIIETTNIGQRSITFSGLSTAIGDVTGPAEYRLYITLKNSLPTSVNGNKFVFTVDQSSFVFEPGSSITGIASSGEISVTADFGNSTTITNATLVSVDIPSTTTTSPGVNVFAFLVVEDDKLPDDWAPTLISKIEFTQNQTYTSTELIGNLDQVIAGAQLIDKDGVGNTQIATSITPNSIVFDGINTAQNGLGYIADGGNNGTIDSKKVYVLSIWLKSSLGTTYASIIDNLKLAFDVKNSGITLAANSTKLVDANQQAIATLANTIQVEATQIKLNNLTNSFIYIYNPLALTAQAIDANGNLDLNYNGKITTFSNTENYTTANGPTVNTDAFTAGTYSFPNNFQFISGDGKYTSLTMSATLGNATITETTQTYTNFIVNSSTDSYLYFDQTVQSFSQIASSNQTSNTLPQNANNTNNTNTVATVARLTLSDGGAFAFRRNEPAFIPIGPGDLDSGPTFISQLKITITAGFNDINQIGIYDDGGMLQATGVKASDSNGNVVVTFTNLNIPSLTAPDNGAVTFTLRATFNKNNYADHDLIAFKVSGAMQPPFGSQFNKDNDNYIGGVENGSTSPTNQVDVVATSLDFTTQPSQYAGILQPVVTKMNTPPLQSTNAGIVTARDANQRVDIDFDNIGTNAITITSIARDNITAPRGFSMGVLDLKDMVYNQTGDGTLTVQVTSVTVTPATSDPVKVIHTDITYPTGLESPSNRTLKAKSERNTIFGLTFKASGATTTSDEPKLSKFTISFNVLNSPNSYFKQFYLYDGNNKDITNTLNNPTFQFTQSTGSSTWNYTISFKSPQSLANEQPLTYYIVADVVDTPPSGSITPSFSSLSNSTTTNVDVTLGSAYSNTSSNTSPNTSAIVGNTYTFVSFTPPVLLAAKSIPYTGQLNVNPEITSISLKFDVPVISLDYNTPLSVQLVQKAATGRDIVVADLVEQNVTHFTTDNFDPMNNTFKSDVTGNRILIYNIQFRTDDRSNTKYKFEYDSVYYMTIAPGQLTLGSPLSASKGVGISDTKLNYFGGISSSNTYYFKINSNKAPNLTSIESKINAPGVGTLVTQFDQLGSAYYTIVPKGSTPPTFSEIRNQNYVGAVAGGSYTIDRVNANQTVTFPANYTERMMYDVYVIAANNDTPPPIAQNGNTTAYPVFTAGIYTTPDPVNPTTFTFTNSLTDAGPTYRFTANFSTYKNKPTYSICPNSNVVVTEPIIIVEDRIKHWSSQNAQTFFLSLPTGFEFDINKMPKVQLIGADFDQSFSKASYVNNTLLRISYKNTGASSSDYIVISDIPLRSNGSFLSGGAADFRQSIYRFYGQNTSFDSPTQELASLSTSSTTPLQFDNSYSINNGPFPQVNNRDITPVNAIPSNYIDSDPTIPKGSVRLYPNIPTGDYNPTTFSGNGVTNDLLNLTSAQLGALFTITMTHTDLNGCVIQTPQQYLVYNPDKFISPLLGEGAPSKNIPAGTAQAIVNSNFPKPADFNTLNNFPLQYNANARFYLSNLSVDLPKEARVAVKKDTVLSGPLWQNWVHQLLLKNSSSISVGINGPYLNYNWDYTYILNANTSSNFPTNITAPTNTPDIATTNGYTNVYNGPQGKYAKITNVSNNSGGNKYWTGGTLGKVEFTGVYNSTADFSVFLPFKQQVELFVPPVPLIEVPNIHMDDLNDVTTNQDKTTVPTATTIPNQHINQFQFPNGTNPKLSGNNNYGTTIYCENDGLITINGYPAPLSSQNGVFDVFDFQSYDFSKTPQENASNSLTIDKTPNHPVPYADKRFTDNHNGSATIDPHLLTNGYNDILITYTYSESNSPASAVAYRIIRVTPNPVARFTAGSVIAKAGKPGAVDSTAFCVGSVVQFNASQSSISPSSQNTINSITTYAWDYGDGARIVPEQNSNVPGLLPPPKYIAQHTYRAAGRNIVTLKLTSNWGCASTLSVTPSLPTVTTSVGFEGSTGIINVGEIPQPDFTFSGNCLGSNIPFKDITKTLNDHIVRFQWNFDFSGNSTSDTTNFMVYYNSLNHDSYNPDQTLFNKFINNTTPKGDAVINHQYTQPGVYTVEERVTSSFGCINRTQKFVGVLNTFSSKDFPLNFDSDSSGWIGLDISGKVPNFQGKIVPAYAPGANVSWKWGQSQAKAHSAFNTNDPQNPDALANPNNKNWSTTRYKGKDGTTYYPAENSALYTGCFDLNISRPVLSFDSYVDLNDGDGVVLQWSSDDKNIMDLNKVWNTLGTDATGSEPGFQWYTKAGIASNPGSYLTFAKNPTSYGWTGTSSSWIAPKHSLDAISLSNTSNPIIFRFALASLSTTNSAYTDGIGIDRVSFGSRNRTVLLENFTTTDGGGVVPNKTLLDEANAIQSFYSSVANSTQLANINYHIGLVGDDPFYLDNTADASARSLYYNIKQVPWALIDGVHSPITVGKDLFQDWGKAYYDLQTLQIAKANFLDPSATPTTVSTTNIDGTVTADVHFTPLVDLPANTVLHMAVLEKEINTIPSYGKVITGETKFYYTMKKLVPDATGTKIGALTAKTPFNLSNPLKWIPNRNKLHGSSLAVVLFLQNDDTKEIYQAELFDNLPLPTPVTDVTPLSAENVTIYPNPSDDEFNIVLPRAATQPISIYLVNQLGQQTEVGLFTEGEQKKTISTKNFQEGLYILQIGGDNAIVRSKLIVLHK